MTRQTSNVERIVDWLVSHAGLEVPEVDVPAAPEPPPQAQATPAPDPTAECVADEDSDSTSSDSGDDVEEAVSATGMVM